MNIPPYSVFNTVIHDACEYIPYIMDSFFLDPEAVNLQMKETKQDIKDDTSDYLINNTTPNKNILNTANEKIKYIKAYLKPLHTYPEPTATPISQLYYPYTQDHLNTDLNSEALATTTDTAIASTHNTSSPSTMYTLAPANLLSYSTGQPCNFLTIHPPENPREEPTSIPYYTQIYSPIN